MKFKRLAYTIVLWVLFPYVIWRIGQRHQWQKIPWHEYFGFVPNNIKSSDSQIVIWVHMVSVGEVQAAVDLLEYLNQQDDVKICLSSTTLPAREQLQKKFPDAWISVLPLDYPFAVKRFFMRCQPDIGIILEAEFWPNLIAEAKKRKVNLILANARLSHRSARRFRWVSSLFKECIQSFSLILAQTHRDAGRLRCYRGAPIACVGNLKFDSKIKHHDKMARLCAKPILLLASTREGEEALLFKAMDKLFLDTFFIIIAVRHPHRAEAVMDFLKQHSIKAVRRSQQPVIDDSTKVYIADTMGEMNHWYAMSDVAIIGGSFIDYGGQNPIEAMQAQVPVIIGPYVRNYKRLVNRAASQKAIVHCQNASDAINSVDLLMEDTKRQVAIQAGNKFCKSQQGSLQHHIKYINTILNERRKKNER